MWENPRGIAYLHRPGSPASCQERRACHEKWVYACRDLQAAHAASSVCDEDVRGDRIVLPGGLVEGVVAEGVDRELRTGDWDDRPVEDLLRREAEEAGERAQVGGGHLVEGARGDHLPDDDEAQPRRR